MLEIPKGNLKWGWENTSLKEAQLKRGITNYRNSKITRIDCLNQDFNCDIRGELFQL